MNRILKISFTLKNTYRVNGILFSIKQIPLLKRWLPDNLYRVKALKVVGNIISLLWEIISAFLGKFIYVLLMLVAACKLYPFENKAQLFLHILVFLTVIGSFANTYMFNPTKDKYYAMSLMRMDCRGYTLVNYFYSILRVLIGFGAAALIFCRGLELPVWMYLLIPFSVAGIKLSVAAYSLWDYEKKETYPNENRLGVKAWVGMLALVGAAYGLPAVGIVLPQKVSAGVLAVCALSGVLALRKILRFGFYREIYKGMLADTINQTANVKELARQQSHKLISADTAIISKRKGFEYLNELFIKRHQKILWKSVKRITMVCVTLILACLLVFYLRPDTKETINNLILSFLPYFAFIMYAINRGTQFTGALFMNCDHSLLTYSFYKKPGCILKSFQVRLREIIKINALPASVIGCGLAVLLYASGGTDNPLNYVVLIVSVICLSTFFSVHYLTVYYLLQPYTVESEMKSGMYQVIMWVTYIVCYCIMQIEMPTIIFGVMTIIFCILYCVVASILVYKFASKTFKLRT